MAKFAYNNAKNANTSNTPFELDCEYHFCVFYKENFNLQSKLKAVEKLFSKF